MSKKNEHVPLHAIKTKEMGPMGFGVIDLNGNYNMTYDSSVPHRHTFYELVFFKKAEGMHEIDFNHFPIENNSVHFVSPGQIHNLTLKKTQGHVICFTEEFVSLKHKERFVETFPFYDSASYPVLNLSKELGAEIGSLVSFMSHEIQTGTSNVSDICRSYLNIILLKIKTCYTHTLSTTKSLKPNVQKQKILFFKKLIEKHYLSHEPVSYYASELSISPNHLNALCKQQEGKTATQLIQERLILESKRLLYATEMNSKEIAFFLHFEDVSYFNRFFKKQTLLTPLQYRSQIHKNSLKSAIT